MKSTTLATILLGSIFLLTSCAKSSAVSDTSTALVPTSIVEDESEPTQEQDLLTPEAEYITLVESYLNDVIFKQMEDTQTKPLSDKLLEHYDIIGRTAGTGMDYYVAVRCMDAPANYNLDSISIGHVSGPGTTGETLQIRYFDKDSNDTILYELQGYDLIEMPLGNENLDYLCFVSDNRLNNKEYPAFYEAFTKRGRMILDFLSSKPALTLPIENNPCIEFNYQDQETLKFASYPYSCYINIGNDEIEEIRSLLSSSKTEHRATSWQDALKYLHEKDNIHSIGARLHIDGRNYELLENGNAQGYLMSEADGAGSVIIDYNEGIYHFVIDKIQDAVKMDYSNFDAQWFQTPLRSASIEFPEQMISGDWLDTAEIRTQTITDIEKLSSLSELMDNAINSEERYGFSACPYTAVITFLRKDGETRRIFIATDSCDSMAYEGRIGFEYGNQSDLAAIFDDAMSEILME